MQTTPNRRVVLARRPHGEPSTEDFRLETVPVTQPGDGEILTRTVYLSLDPYMRGRMNEGPSYSAPVAVGGVMEGGAVSRIEASRHPDFPVGGWVVGRTGWQDYALGDGRGLRRLDPRSAPLSTALGVLGMPGMTAYTGLLNIGKPRAGETLVVAAASGAVGSVVGQIARIKGLRVVGVAGGARKCAYVTDELGFDACIDHHAEDFAQRLAGACPDGVDVYFENVAGRVLEAVIPLLNDFSRMPVCGLISQYNSTAAPVGVNRLPQLMRAVLTHRVLIRGFIVRDFAAQQQDFLRDVGQWVSEGRIRYHEHRLRGLANAPQGLIDLLAGRNFGKVVVEVAAEDERRGEDGLA